MNKRNAKTLGISLALMLVMCVATALLSFSLADDTTPDDGRSLVSPATATLGTTSTNIDYIIQNSIDGATDESGRDLSKFYIVEIGSAASDAQSPLKAMVTEDLTSDTSETDISHFVKQVINGWSTSDPQKEMKPNKISYQYFSVSALNTDAKIQEAITAVGKADLIYVSNNPTTQYGSTNDIPEDLKLLLSAAATSTYTPFIIDSPTKTNSSGSAGGSTSNTMSTFTNQVLVKAGYYRDAFSYDLTKSTDVTKYLDRTDTNSLWLPISGTKQSGQWFKDADNKTTARILTISKEGATAVTEKIKGALGTTVYDLAALKTDEAYAKNAALFELTGTAEEQRSQYDAFFTGKEAYSIEGTTFYAYGYNLSQDRPDNVILETMQCGTDGKLDFTGMNLDQYDLIILEGDLSNVVLSTEQYNMLYSTIYGLQHYIYNATMIGSSAQNGDDKDDIVVSDAANYAYVMTKVADANEKARFSNVLVTCMNDMKIYGAASAPSGVKAIVDIINNGAYRGSGGGSSSSNLYTVLEVQPCYPIDYELAKVLQNFRSFYADKARQNKPRDGWDDQNIFYYLKHDSVLNDTTTDEISFDGGITSLSDMESTDDAISGISSRGAVQNSSLLFARRLYAQPAYSKIVYAKPVYAKTAYAKKMRQLTKVKRSVQIDGTWTEIEVYDAQTYWDGSGARDLYDDEGYIVYKGEYLVDANGDPVYETDADGNILLFADKKDYTKIQLYYNDASGTRHTCDYKYDNGYVAYDAYVTDADGNVLTFSDKSGNSDYVIYGYETDADGNVILYEDKADDSSYVAYGYKTDDSGKVILYSNKKDQKEYARNGYMTDASGNVIVSETQLEGYESYGTDSNLVDYYAWELSRAKIAHLTGLDYNKVKVVHMSSVEFDTSRETLLDNYDMIYIGGKNTAIRQAQYIAKDGRTDENKAVYNMYFRDGGTYSVDGKYAVLTGNDITYDKYVELQKYIQNGMPVVFTKVLTEAYYGAFSLDSSNHVVKNYNQTLLDPDSNMFKLLNWAMDSSAADTVDGELVYKTSKANVLAGFDPADQIKVPNTGGELGDTYGGYATVFGGLSTDTNVYVRTTLKDDEGNDVKANVLTPITTSHVAVNAKELHDLIFVNATGSRPKFSLIQAPASYVEGDPTTEITAGAAGTTITFKYDVSSRNTYKVNIYVDDNTNSVFEDPNEILYTGTANPVRVTLPSSFDGGLYWKFEIVAGNCKSSTTGLSKVHVRDRNYVNVLQIAPKDADNVKENNDLTLLFCTECQQARGILRGNRYASEGKYTEHVAIGSSFGEGTYNPGGSLPNPGASDTGYTNPTTNTLGVHDHNFGIVKYDSNYTIGSATGTDNWETNWAEDVYNEYDVDMDILTTREFEAYVADAVAHVDAANAATVQKGYESLASIYKNYYLTMCSVIDGSVNQSSTSYTYLKNKITSTAALFVESELNHLFGEDEDAYALETAKGGLASGTDANAPANLNDYIVAQMNIDSYLTALGRKMTGNMDKCTNAQLKQEIAYEIKYHRYNDFFSLSNSHNDSCSGVTYTKYSVGSDGTITSTTATANNSIYTEFNSLYVPWRDAKVYEKYFYKMYMKYLTYATMKEYKGTYLPDLTEVYTCVVVGVAEKFGSDDIQTDEAIATLQAYVEKEGNTFIFHQTINDSGSTQKLTAGLKDLFGQNYNKLTTDVTQVAETNTYAADSDSSKTNHYYSPLLKDTRTAAQKIEGSDQYVDPASISLTKTHRTMVNSGVWGNDEKETRFMYTQSALLYSDTQVPNTHKNFDAAKFYTASFTNRATQTNKGLVTMYPFLIASQLRIGQTHPNTFSTDIADKDLVVYYTLAGGSTGNQSSLVAADPQDGIDNYWLYSYGSVTYCGAGHSSITGIHVDNNDERRLFINIILNSVKKSVFGPTISVYDPYPVTNVAGESEYINKDITMTEDGIYEMTIPNLLTIPEFTYRVTVPDSNDEVDEVKIYFDLSNNASGGDGFGFVTGTDVMIFNANSTNDPSILKDLYKLIGRALSTLTLDQSYFTPYDNKYTYIVIAVKTRKGIYTTQRIMVKLAPKLWDLT